MKAVVWVLLVSFCCSNGCTDAPPEAYEAGKCYEAVLIKTFCPSIAEVSVTNANIGVDWDWNGKSYKHVLTLLNYSIAASITEKTSIYFTINVDATRKGETCSLVLPCPFTNALVPDKGVCANYIATKPCP